MNCCHGSLPISFTTTSPDSARRDQLFDINTLSRTVAVGRLQFIEESGRIADALGEPHLQVEVSKALVRINKAVNGLAYLRPQRLYLATRKHVGTAPS